MTHVAWSCDGKRLAAVGIDKVTRVWVPEKGVRHQAVVRAQVLMLRLDGAEKCEHVLRRALGRR